MLFPGSDWAFPAALESVQGNASLILYFFLGCTTVLVIYIHSPPAVCLLHWTQAGDELTQPCLSVISSPRSQIQADPDTPGSSAMSCVVLSHPSSALRSTFLLCYQVCNTLFSMDILSVRRKHMQREPGWVSSSLPSGSSVYVPSSCLGSPSSHQCLSIQSLASHSSPFLLPRESLCQVNVC